MSGTTSIFLEVLPPYLIINQAITKFQSDKKEDVIPAIIYAFSLTAIIVGGLVIFGKYALQGEYDK